MCSATVLAVVGALSCTHGEPLKSPASGVLFDLGRMGEAADVQTTAISFLDERSPDRKGYEERLARYKAALASP